MLTNRLPAFRLPLVLFFAGAFAARGAEPADVLERLRTDGDLGRAKTDLMRGLLVDPKRPASLFNLGAIAERERDWSAAADFYDRAVKADPRSPVAQAANERLAAVQRIAGLSATPGGREQLLYEVSLARASEAQASGRLAEAISTLESAIRVSPERWEAQAMIGAMLAVQGRNDEAAGYLRAARRNAPAGDTARFDRAIEALLSPSWHLFDSALAGGGRWAAQVQQTVRQTLELRGGERIKEAAALLVAKDIDAAVRVLTEAASASPAEAPVAWRMLRELGPVSADAKDYVARTSEPVGASRNAEALLRDPVSDEARRVAAPPPLLVEDRRAPVTAAAAVAQPAQAPVVEAPPVRVATQSCPEPAPAAPVAVVPPARAPLRTTIVVQVAAYRDAKGAEAMARTLVAKGFDARAREEGAVFRVIIGPLASERSAAELREHLAREGYSGFVRSQAGD